MIIGTKDSFAVEYELDTDFGGKWMYGKVCYWINGKQIGDYELGTSLSDVLFQLKYMIHDNDKRDDESLCLLSPSDIFFQINESIYGENKKVYAYTPETPAKFNISIPVDVFDQWKIFLVDCNESSIVVYKKLDDVNVHFAYIPKGIFDQCINKLYTSLESIYDGISTSVNT